jgi:hypothetical protein
LQDNTIFASLQLNADLWRNSVVQDIVKGSFIFCQRVLPGRDAQQLQVRVYLCADVDPRCS